jgi:hypothetical protein
MADDHTPDPRSTTRRRTLELCAGAAAWTWTRTVVGAAAPGDVLADDEALDPVLRLLHAQEPESKQGLSTHAPMVAEALCAIGQGSHAEQWLREYRAPVLRLAPPSLRIEPDRWRSALGAVPGARSWEEALVRWADWREFFLAQLDQAPWTEVLDTWTGRLSPGLCAAATHGVIRTAHAARALARRQTPVRRAELARGLAYWAAAYQELPARAGAAGAGGSATYAQALERLPLYWDTHGRFPGGNIVNGLREAGMLEGFDRARDLVAAPANVASAVSAMTATAARAYLRHGTQGRAVAAIAFVHGVTGPAALRRLAPHVRPATAAAALPYAWQALAGIYTAYARRDDRPRDLAVGLSAEELVARAIRNGDEHAIKFTEALLAEHALNPDPAYLAAAADAVGRL